MSNENHPPTDFTPTSNASLLQRPARPLRGLSGPFARTPSRDVSVEGSIPTSSSMNFDEQSSQSTMSGHSKPPSPRRSRFSLGNYYDSGDYNAAMRSGINDLISKKVRRAQRDDEPISLHPDDDADPFVLRPDMVLRRCWDMYNLVLLVYVATVSVFVFSFLGVLGPSSPWFWVERFIDLSFTVDICLNFFTAYENGGVLVTDRKAIRHHYARTWLIPDILATFPWDTLALSLQIDRSKPNILQLPHYFRLVRLFKLIQLTRILRLKQGFTQLEVRLRLKYGYIRLAGLFFSVVFMAHWFACLFFYFGSIGGFEMNWITQEGVPTDLHGQYIAALYFSVYTITTIGYGDVVPENTLERSFTTVIMFLGAAMFAYIISQVSNIAGELNASSAQQRRVMDSLTDFASYRHLPDNLVYDIRRYFQREHLRQRVADEEQLLGSINRDLRIKVLKHMYGTHLEHSRLLRDIPSGHLDDVYNSVMERFARKDEKLFSEGDDPNCFYIILNGEVELYEPGVPVVILGDNEIFGDDDLLFNRPRESTAICSSYTDLIVVPRDAVISTLDRHPTQWKNLRDEEALCLWDKAINVVEQQIRYTKLAGQLRRCGDTHMQTRGSDQHRGNSQEVQSEHPPSTPHVPQEARLAKVENSAVVTTERTLPHHETTADLTWDHGTSREERSAVKAIRSQLKVKTDQVQELESKLLDLQKQLELILRGVRENV